MNTTSLHRAVLLALAAPLALAACGGGGGGGMVRNPPPPSAPAAPPPQPPPPPPAGFNPCPAPVTADCVVTLGGSTRASLPAMDSNHGLVVRAGEGQLGLVADSYRFGGGTTVESGELAVGIASGQGNSRTVLRSAVEVRAPARLVVGARIEGDVLNQGTTVLWETIAGDVDNRGRLQASAAAYGNRPEILGDFSQSADATLAFALAPAGWDSPVPLRVEGRATLAGTLELALYADDWGPYAMPATGGHHILHAAGGVAGTFDRWTAPGLFIEGSLRYGPTDVWFDLRRLSLQSAMASRGFGGVALASAGHLDRALGIADGFAALPATTAAQSRFLQSAARLLWLPDAAQAARSLESLSGAEHAQLASQAQARAGVGAGRLAMLAGSRPMDGMPSRWSRPLEGGRIDGHELWLDSRTLVGGSLAREASASGAAAAEDRRASLYLHRRGEAWQATLVATAGRSQGLLQRRIDLADGRLHLASAPRRVDLAQLHLELARPLSLAGGQLHPYLALDAGAVRGDRFLELGDTGFELASDGGVLRQAGASVGLRFARDWRIGAQPVRLLAELGETQRLLQGGQWQAAYVGVAEAGFDLRDWRAARSRSAQLSLQGGAPRGWQWAVGGQLDQRLAAPLSWRLRIARSF